MRSPARALTVRTTVAGVEQRYVRSIAAFDRGAVTKKDMSRRRARCRTMRYDMLPAVASGFVDAPSREIHKGPRERQRAGASYLI